MVKPKMPNAPEALPFFLTASLGLSSALFVEVRAATSLSGDQWVREGLAVTSASTDTPRLLAKYAGGIAISPNGKDIAFVVQKPHAMQNANEIKFSLVKRLDLEPLARPTELGKTAGGILDARLLPQFSPDGKSLAYVANHDQNVQSHIKTWFENTNDAIAIRNLSTGSIVLANTQSISTEALGGDFALSGIRSFRWSPDGTRLAVIVATRLDRKLEAGGLRFPRKTSIQ